MTKNNKLKYIYPFGGSARPTETADKQIVGGKGLGLQVMSKIGVDVPPGFTLTTPLCQVYQKEKDLPAEVWKGVRDNVERVERDMNKKFGSSDNPLLFSCRSGAASKLLFVVLYRCTVIHILLYRLHHVTDICYELFHSVNARNDGHSPQYWTQR